MATSQGPSSGNGVLAPSVPGTAGGSGGFAPTASVEVQVPAGLPSLEPSRAPFVDPTQAGTTITGGSITPVNTTIVFGTSGATLKFANPA